MARQALLPDFQLVNGDGRGRPFRDFLADFSVVLVRRVPVASHGPATELLRRLIEENRGVDGETVRGFDIRSPDQPCETCGEPHIVFTGPDLATVCDSDGSILRKFGVEGAGRFFVVRSGPQVQAFDIGTLEEMTQFGEPPDRSMVPSSQCTTRAPPLQPDKACKNTAA